MATEEKELFTHLFGGREESKAYRWINPDGSVGGIVAEDATIPEETFIPNESVVWPYAFIGYGASIGAGASIGYGAFIWYGVSIGDGAFIGDGASIGPHASIGYHASIGPHASIGYRASIGPHASIEPRTSIGDGASIGDGTSIGYGDWWLSGGPCGSRNAFWTAVYSKENGLRWWVGCQGGITTEFLKERIACDHGQSHYGDDYLAAISFVENHPGLKRAMSANEEVLGDE